MKILLPIELTVGNDGQGFSWHATAATRKRLGTQIRILCGRRKPIDYQVDLVITRVLGPRQKLCDSANLLRGNAKQLLDALVACGWFVDDGPKWIRHCDGRQDASRRKVGPAVEIEIIKV